MPRSSELLCMEPYRYERADERWRRTDTVEILSVLDSEIAYFHLAFVERGGDNTWQYILNVVQQLVEQDPLNPGRICTSAEGEDAVDVTASPHAGTFYYVQQGVASEVTFSRGPEYFSSRLVPQLLPDETTRSASSRESRSRPEQSRFLKTLIGRDSGCLLTNAPFDECVAAHIVPQSRPDVYRDILNRVNPPMFGAAAGLLVTGDLHRAFDRLDWSLYLKDEVYYVHFFIVSTKAKEDLHGKAIPLTRFSNIYEPPDPRLVAWHYTQAVKARIRGFSVRMMGENSGTTASSGRSKKRRIGT